MTQTRETVFVYGTLRNGGSNHFRMDGAEFLAAGHVLGKIYRIDWYPGLVLDDAGDPVTGEVYAVGPEQLRALDEFEGLSAGEIEGSEYRRVRTAFTSIDGQETSAWAWEWLGPIDEASRIANGDWLASRS